MIQNWKTCELPGRCPGCRGPLTVLRASESKRPASDGKVRLCLRCIARLLCRAAIAIHGDIGERPASSDHPGHEARMAAHEERVWSKRGQAA